MPRAQRRLLEICVDTLEGARAAIRGGAGRIELCSALSEGGLTPSVGLMRAAAALTVPCFAMIRPRSGLFHFSMEDEAIMCADIDAAKSAGLAGVVLGAQGADGGLDREMLSRLAERAGDLGLTLHRVIDVVPEPLVALDIAIDLGFERVLTSGAKPLAPDGVDLIAAMVKQAHGRIGIMPGSGLAPDNVAEVINATGVVELHAACSVAAPGDPAFSDFDPPGGRRITSETEVRRLLASIHEVSGA